MTLDETVALGKRLARLRATLETRSTNFMDLYDDVSEFILPGRREIRTKREPGAQRTEKIFNHVATESAMMAAAAAHGAMTPSSFKWFTPQFEDRTIRAIGAAQDWAYDTSVAMFEAINDSNFHAESPETWLDILAYGTGCFFTDEDLDHVESSGSFAGLRCSAFQPGSFWFSEDAQGYANVILRDFCLPLIEIREKFGEDALNEKLRRQLERSDDLYKEIELVHAVLPASHVPETKTSKPYVSVYFVKSDKHVLYTGTYSAFPGAIPRWSKASGEHWGRGPGVNVMPTIRVVNKTIDLVTRNAAKIIDPPMSVLSRSAVGRISLAPAALNYFRIPNALQKIDAGGRLDLAQLVVRDMEEAIRRAFLVDQISFPPMRGTPASATEIVTRMELMQRILGPVYGRIVSEWHSRFLTRVYTLMAERRALPDPPQELLDAVEGDVTSIRFTFENSISRAQGLVDVEAVQRALTFIAGYVQVWPEMSDYVDTRAIGKFVLEANRVPATLIRNDKDAQAAMEGRDEADQVDQATQSTESISQALKNVTPLLQGQNATP